MVCGILELIMIEPCLVKFDIKLSTLGHSASITNAIVTLSCRYLWQAI